MVLNVGTENVWNSIRAPYLELCSELGREPPPFIQRHALAVTGKHSQPRPKVWHRLRRRRLSQLSVKVTVTLLKMLPRLVASNLTVSHDPGAT